MIPNVFLSQRLLDDRSRSCKAHTARNQLVDEVQHIFVNCAFVAEHNRQQIGNVIWEISKNLGMLCVKCLPLSSIPCISNHRLRVLLANGVERLGSRSNCRTLIAHVPINSTHPCLPVPPIHSDITHRCQIYIWRIGCCADT